MSRSALVVLAMVGAGCIEQGSLLPADFASCEPGPSTPGPTGPFAQEGSEAEIPSGPTYFRDVKGILDAKCAGCHVEGGIAPFALTSYHDVSGGLDLIADAVETRRMPPWQPNDCCGDFHFVRALTEPERETVLRWAAQGGPMGDPSEEPTPLPRDAGGLSRVDVTLKMPAPYVPVPTIGVDELRCFLIDWPYDEEVFVRGVNVRPGNRTIVHHVAVLSVTDDQVADLEAQDAAADGAGWPCNPFGFGAEANGNIGGWAPGFQGVEFPDGIGRRIPGHSKVLLNIHYDLSHGVPEPDQTEVDVMVSDTVTHEALGMGVGNPLWLVKGGMHIGAGDPDAMHNFAFDPTDVFTRKKPFWIYSVYLHMHELGSRGSLAILRADGTTDCLLDIPKWDFGWMGEYWLKEPVRVNPGDRLYVECHWDNTQAHQKFVLGEPLVPRDLGWGNDEEMCGGLFTIVVED